MYYLGVDLGGTHIAVGLTDENGNLICKESFQTLSERGYEAVIQDIASACERVMCASPQIERKLISSIGIGVPGVVDNKKGVVTYACNINFKNVDIKKELNKYISLPIHLGNDANCAALGESVSGASKGFKSSIAITLGTGVGGGIIIDNKIFNGAFKGGAEFGHHVIKFDGVKCSCGRFGCFESYASVTALIREAKVAAKLSIDSEMNKITKGNLEAINGRTIFLAAKEKDSVALSVIEKYLQHVACGIVNLINIFQPEIVVIGGGISEQGDIVLLPIRKHVKESVFGGELKTQIASAKLGNDAGIVGAAMLGKYS